METEKKPASLLSTLETAKKKLQMAEEAMNTKNREKTALVIEETGKRLKTENEEEPIVIPDECGDTLWDAVLAQETNNFIKLNRQ